MILRRLCVTAACVHALSTPVSAMSRLPAHAPDEQASAVTDLQDSVTRQGVKPRHDFGGFMQVYYRVRRDANGDGVVEPSLFRVQRVRLQAKGRVNARVAYEVDIDPRAPEVAGLLRDAIVTLSYIPRHDIRVGQMKTTFGYENPTSSSRLFTVNRTELSEGLGRGVNLRDIGGGIDGFVRLGNGWRLEDAITVVNGAGLNVQADDTPRKNVWGRLGLRYRRDSLTVRWGTSLGNGDQHQPADTAAPTIPAYTFTFNRRGTDVQIDHPRLLFVAEAATGEDKAPLAADASGRSNAYYALAVGKTRWGVGPIVRYDVLEEFKRWTVGAYAGLPSSKVSFLFNYEKFEDAAGVHDDRVYARLQVRF